jgi:hypothetical protein
VHCDDSEWVDKAKAILKRTGASDISSTKETTADFDATDKPQVRHGGGGTNV